MRIAHAFLGKGELRLALRAMFLGGLARLSKQNQLVIAAYKSNREYCTELHRRAHDRPSLIRAFVENVNTLERVWYGLHEVTQDMVDVFSLKCERLTRAADDDSKMPPPSLPGSSAGVDS